MPMQIKYIDKIAREKNRDVVFVSFEPEIEDTRNPFDKAPYHLYRNYEEDANRIALISWLQENNIAFQCMANYASEGGFMAYSGNLYIDVPFDTSDAGYELVRQYLENDDGSLRNPKVKFWFLPLADAMKNAHHDEPGFWEKWAETF